MNKTMAGELKEPRLLFSYQVVDTISLFMVEYTP